jgi:hypothetical protein
MAVMAEALSAQNCATDLASAPSASSGRSAMAEILALKAEGVAW